MLSLNTIHCGDCLELVKDIEDKSIDMILCDLPYGVTQNKWDSIIPLDTLWNQYKRISKDNAAIVLTAIQPFASMLICSNPLWFKYEWIWQKDKATGFLNANRAPLRIHENILTFYSSPPVYNPQKFLGNPCHTRGKATGQKGKTTNYGSHIGGETIGDMKFPLSIIKFNKDTGLHPTQKPVALFEYLIKTYSNEGAIVLDNCIGSGTTAEACINTKRMFIGIEKEPQFVKIANDRISGVIKNSELHGGIITFLPVHANQNTDRQHRQ